MYLSTIPVFVSNLSVSITYVYLYGSRLLMGLCGLIEYQYGEYEVFKEKK